MDHGARISAGCRAVFFDRDGVVNKVILKDGQPFSPRKPEEFILSEGILEAVSTLKRRGYKVILISNQPELARGYITQAALDEMMRRVMQEVDFDDIFVCPHDNHHDCACRKPKPGMILDAAEKWKIDLGTSYVIGDTWRDMEAGKSAGCKTILLDAVYNQDVRPGTRVKTLLEAVGIIAG